MVTELATVLRYLVKRNVDHRYADVGINTLM